MPTGYTCEIEKGQSFKDFAIGCAKAFGANIMLRDEPNDTPIPKYEPSEYHKKAAARAKKDLAGFLKKSEDDLREEFNKELMDSLKSAENRTNNARELKQKYEKMLEKVKAFTAPTEDHINYKNFMIEQIETSILFDCEHSYSSEQTEITFEEWKSERLQDFKDNIEYHKRQYKEEVRRTNERNEWNQKLFDALKAME